MTDPNTVSETHTPPRQCLGCGYIIDHLVEPRCPECGREFDPTSPGTYYTEPAGLKQSIIGRGLLGLNVSLFGAGAYVVLRSLGPGSAQALRLYAMIALTCVGAGCLCAARAVFLLWDWLPPWNRRILFRWLLVPALALAMTVLIMTTFVCLCLALVLLVGLIR